VFGDGETFQGLLEQMTGDGSGAIPKNALVAVETEEGGLITHRFGRLELTVVGVNLPEDTSQDEWMVLGDTLAAMETSLPWWVGDWARFASTHWGIDYEQIAARFGVKVDTLYTYASTCAKFETSIRNRGVSFGHHRAMQGLEKRWAIHWLERAAEGDWTVDQLRAEIKKAKGKRERVTRPTLLADPALHRGKRLISKQNELVLVQKLTALARIKDGVLEAEAGTKAQIRELADEVSAFLEGLARWVE